MVAILTPLRDCPMELQEKSANAETAVDVINYLRRLSRTQGSIGKSVQDVFTKWIFGNDVVRELVHGSGPFYDYVKLKMRPEIADYGNGHTYDGTNFPSFL